jgi:hypothetical protein
MSLPSGAMPNHQTVLDTFGINRYAFVKKNLRRNTETSASLLEKDKSLLRSTSINAQHAPLLPQEIGPSNGLLGLGVNHQRRSRKTCT